MSRLLAEARHTHLGGRLAYKIEASGIAARLPPQVRYRLEADRRAADRYSRTIRWEAECLRRVLSPVVSKIVLLKGAAYVLSELPVSRGRVATDVDILVDVSELHRVEQTLLESGWIHIKDRDYDRQYYREYMHELPPFLHRERGTVVDVHHGILPRTSRIRLDGARLLRLVEPIGETGLWRLSNEDMILHAAVHLFQDGEVAGSLRELVDLDDLFRAAAREEGFAERLFDRAGDLGLNRPLFYSLRYCEKFLDTPLTGDVVKWMVAVQPAAPVRTLMDWLVADAFRPPSPFVAEQSLSPAPFLLYLRSHWLRMPPLLLARHLSRKALMSVMAKLGR